MIDFGLSDEYLNGYRARRKNTPYDDSKSEEWRMGWINANQALKHTDDPAKNDPAYNDYF